MTCLLSRRPQRTRGVLAVLAVVIAVVLSGCATESAAQACARGPLFANARARAERAVAELDRTTTIELEESVTSVVDQLLLLREVSPRDLRDPLGVLVAAYGQLVLALDGVAWNPQVADSDAAVTRARGAFAETSVAQSVDSVSRFFAQQCEIAIGESDPLFAMSGTTLPLPEVTEEATLDADEASSVSESELQAIGYVIGETYGVALVASEAECVARTLGVTFGEASDAEFNDGEFFAEVVKVFASCGVATPPTTTPDN
jgi:hypothetical protein